MAHVALRILIGGFGGVVAYVRKQGDEASGRLWNFILFGITAVLVLPLPLHLIKNEHVPLNGFVCHAEHQNAFVIVALFLVSALFSGRVLAAAKDLMPTLLTSGKKEQAEDNECDIEPRTKIEETGHEKRVSWVASPVLSRASPERLAIAWPKQIANGCNNLLELERTFIWLRNQPCSMN